MADGASDDLLASLGRIIRRMRLRIGLTIEELSELFGLDVLTLETIERGEGRRLTLPALADLARALGVAAPVRAAGRKPSTLT